jgi:very-short-patch-repair endonuclease
MMSTVADLAVAKLACRQHGAFSRLQARAAGLSDRQIDRRAACGAWIRLAPGVYALPGNPPTWQRQVMAAVLAEQRAWASVRSAANLLAFQHARPGRPEITVPRGANHRNPLAIIHQSDRIAVTTVDNIPTTTIEQTVIDLSAVVPLPQLTETIDDLLVTRRTTVPKLTARYQQLSRLRRRGFVEVGAMIADRSDTAFVPPSSVLEGALYRVLDDLGMAYERQPAFPWRPDDPFRLDALLFRWMLVLEADGRTWHARAAQMARDRRRDHEAAAHGCQVLRLGWEELIEEPAYARDTILRVGEQRARLLGLPPLVA